MKKFLVATALLATATAAGATNVLVNGDFETGTLAGWNAPNGGIGENMFYSVANGAPTPVSSQLTGYVTPANPNGGGYFAVSDQDAAGAEVLIQSFTVTGPSQTLSFDWYSVNHNEVYSTGGGLSSGSQTMRVDILTSGASPYDTGAGVVQNLLLNQGSASWTNSLFNLTLAAGTYQLRFATSECCYFQELGVDNVVLDDISVPEPAMLGLFGLGAVGLGLARRRKAA